MWILLGLAALDWLALRFGWKRLETFTKPAVMVGILTWMVIYRNVFEMSAGKFFVGIACSLVGDILALPAINRSREAFAAYLAAALAYIIGLNTTIFPVNFSTFLFAVAITLPGWRVYNRISAGLSASGRDQLRLPVLIFTAALGLTVLSGLTTLAREAWSPGSSLLVAGGTVSLAIAAIILGWDRTVRPIQDADLKARAAYHLGQIALATGAFVSGVWAGI
jgi:hypothetical protein